MDQKEGAKQRNEKVLAVLKAAGVALTPICQRIGAVKGSRRGTWLKPGA